MQKLLLPLLLTLICWSCNVDPNRPISQDSLPNSNGGTLDILVVAEESVWSDVAGETLRKYIEDAQYGLPQPESKFTVRQVNPGQFNSLLRRVRNLIILSIDSLGHQTQTNRFAKPQNIYNFSAPTERELAKLIVKHQKEMVNELRQREINHLQKRIIAKHQSQHPTLIANHIKLKIPMDYELEQSDENLLVFWKKGLKSDQGIMVFVEPIDEGAGVIGDRIIPLRDSLTRIYFQGEKEGSYMKVEDLIPPALDNREIDDQFTIETRGLWRMEGDFMGGAFINYSVFDEINNQRIMLDGFVYAPEQQKRNLLLELEAILQTLEIAN